jgi:ammonia channel protein AmtB
MKFNYKYPALISIIVIFNISVLSLAAFLIEGIFNAWIFIYVFVLDIILGFIIYITYSWSLEFSNLKGHINKLDKRAFLKLWHNETLQYISTLTNAIFIIITGGIVAALAPQMVFFQGKSINQYGIFLMLFNHSVLIIYYLVGAWFGILGQYYNRLFQIRLELLKNGRAIYRN